MKEYLRAHWEEEECQRDVGLLRKQVSNSYSMSLHFHSMPEASGHSDSPGHPTFVPLSLPSSKKANCLDGWILPHLKPGVVLGRQQLPSGQLVLHSPWEAVESRLSSFLPALFCLLLLNPNLFWEVAQGDGTALVPYKAVDAASV